MFNAELAALYNAHALLYFSAMITAMLTVQIPMVATNVNVREDIKVTTRIAKMKMSAVLEGINAVHMQIAQTQWALTSANVN